MYYFFPALAPIGVISADYEQQNFEDYSYEEISHHICEEFRKEYTQYNIDAESDESSSNMPDECIIILWRNVPDMTKDKVQLDKTFELLCDEECERKGTVYVRSIHDVVDTYGLESSIHYLYLLNRAGREVHFLDNAYFSTGGSLPDEVFAELDAVDALVKDALSGALNRYTLGNVLEEIDRLIPQQEERQLDRLVSYYWDWQRMKKSIDECRETLGVYHSTFYKFSQIYEKSPYYPEHIKLFLTAASTAKRGTLPEKEPFLRDKAMVEQGEMTVKEFCMRYGITTEIDIPRIEKALTEPRKRLR